MVENNMLDDVRTIKAEVDLQSSTMAELAERLKRVERDFAKRLGEFADVPLERTAETQQLIDSANSQPADAVLLETRQNDTA